MGIETHPLGNEGLDQGCCVISVHWSIMRPTKRHGYRAYFRLNKKPVFVTVKNAEGEHCKTEKEARQFAVAAIEKRLSLEASFNSPSPQEKSHVKAMLDSLTSTKYNPDGEIYFIQAGGAGGFIKIGWTKNLAERFKTLSYMNGSPLKLLASLKGSKAGEHDLHCYFYRHKHHGEWFEPGKMILEMITQISDANPKPTDELIGAVNSIA